MVGIPVFQGKEMKVMLHHLGPILVPVNMGIIEQVTQDELQGRAGQRKGQTFFQASRRFIPLPNIRSLLSLSPKGKATV